MGGRVQAGTSVCVTNTIALALVTGCAGGKQGDPGAVIVENRPKAVELRKRIAALQPKLSDAPVPAKNPMDFDPPLYATTDYVQNDAEKLPNFELFDIGQLEHPEDSAYDSDFPHPSIGQALSLEAKPPAKAKGKGTEMAYRGSFRKAFAIRYIGVTNIYEWRPPHIEVKAGGLPGETMGSYTPGTIKARTFIVDLDKGAIVYGFEAEAETPEKVQFSYDWSKPDSAGTAASAAVQATMKPVLIGKIKNRLETLGNVHF